MDPFIGQVILFAGNFEPKGWAYCDGRLLSISQNSALFSILGTTYGGDGINTFALPDLRGRVAVSPGQGPGLSNYVLGEETGTETVTLLIPQIPAHNHALMASNQTGTANNPEGAVPAQGSTLSGPLNIYGSSPNTAMSVAAVGAAGGSQPHNNLQPLLAINYIIALEGVYPSRG